MDPLLTGRLQSLLEFLSGDGLGDLRVAVGAAVGPILVHEIHIRVWGYLLGQKAHHLARIRHPTGHDQVSHQEPPDGQPFVVQYEIADLPMHLFTAPRTTCG